MKDTSGYLMEHQPYSTNFNLFKDKKIFTTEENNKKIFDKTFFTDHFGRHPTIYVDFKNVTGNTYDEILDSLKTVIHKSFLQHAYLENSEIWTNNNKKMFTKYIDIVECESLNVKQIKTGLKYLSEILCEHFKTDKKVYVFIDEYDAPISNAMYNKSLSNDDLEKIINFIQYLISVLLKNNSHVSRALLNACYQVPTSNNIAHIDFWHDENYCEFYGFARQGRII